MAPASPSLAGATRTRAARHTSSAPSTTATASAGRPQAHLVSKVYLKKHPTLPFCYTINAKDKKMVNDFVKARSS